MFSDLFLFLRKDNDTLNVTTTDGIEFLADCVNVALLLNCSTGRTGESELISKEFTNGVHQIEPHDKDQNCYIVQKSNSKGR